MLAEPAPALSDLALGLVVVALAVRLGRAPAAHPHWRRSFWWAGIAALAGFVHHGVVKYSERWSGPSWALISAMVVVAVSYLLAASAAAAATKAIDPALTRLVALDPTSVYHLAQIVGMVLLYLAVSSPHRQGREPRPLLG